MRGREREIDSILADIAVHRAHLCPGAGGLISRPVSIGHSRAETFTDTESLSRGIILYSLKCMAYNDWTISLEVDFGSTISEFRYNGLKSIHQLHAIILSLQYVYP